MINNKGLTDEEIQKLIDWKIDCKKIDEVMWKTKEIIKQIIYDNIREEYKEEKGGTNEKIIN
jgi:hypothetical protein